MKILMIAPYVTINSRLEFSRNKTGFGYMVYDIAKSVGKLVKVDMLCTDSRGDGFDDETVTFLKRSLLLYIIHLAKSISISIVIHLYNRYRMQRGTVIRLFYYWMMTGYLSSLLKERKYDIVHIHGCGFDTELWMKVCDKCNQKYVVTLHGLNSFSNKVSLESAGKIHERDFLKKVANGEIPITVISSGMKRIIEKTFDKGELPNIFVVCNSFSFKKDKNTKGTFDIRDKYGIPKSAKIILYVGNIIERKNQGQLILSFNLLPDTYLQNTYILFLGISPEHDYSVKKFASQTKYPEHFVDCGMIDKALVPIYYEQGDAVALISLSEGFGLSLIEGMHFGLPCITFTDIDAFDDIYDEKAVVGVPDHQDQSVAFGIRRILSNNWDKGSIMKYSKKFSIEFMAENYKKVYNIIVSDKC